MKACFQIAECSFASAKILQKTEITKRFATFFKLSPIFSCEIKISVVSLQNEEEDKKEKRGGPENKKVDQKGGPETRNAILQLIASNRNNSQIYFTIPTSILGFMWLFFNLILEKVYDLTFVIIEKVCNFLVFIIKKLYLCS